MENLSSERGGVILVYEGYIYNRTTLTAKESTWRWKRRYCNGRIKMNISNQIIKYSSHCHDKEENKVVKLKFDNRIKERSYATNETFDEALEYSCYGFKKRQIENLKNYESIRDGFSRRRRNEAKKAI
jgi:hypothetical protein